MSAGRGFLTRSYDSLESPWSFVFPAAASDYNFEVTSLLLTVARAVAALHRLPCCTSLVVFKDAGTFRVPA
jgi:hypothetical protein